MVLSLNLCRLNVGSLAFLVLLERVSEFEWAILEHTADVDQLVPEGQL